MNFAVLLSGGTGSRLGSAIPKQYLTVSGRRIFTYSLQTLAGCPQIDAICIAADPKWRETIETGIQESGIPDGKFLGFSDPGETRQGSILNALSFLLEKKEILQEDAVLIHDAARPLVSGKQLEACFAALCGHDGVMPALPMKDTVYLSPDGKRIGELLDRSRVYAGQAPEVFRLLPYYQANLSLSREQFAAVCGSSEPAVSAGMDIAIIPGDEGNFKITTNADLKRFEQILREKEGGERF